MSFKDLERGGQRVNASKMQPKQWHQEEESTCEHRIKLNIQKMQENVRIANERLDRADRMGVSKRISESLNSSVECGQELIQETEQLFRDLTVQLAGEPRTRLRKKFAYEKLEKAFNEEKEIIKDTSRRASLLATKVADIEMRSTTSPFSMPLDEDHCLLSARESMCFASIVEENMLVATEAPGLAYSSSTKLAAKEMKETAERRRLHFEHLFCVSAFAMLLVCILIIHHLHPWDALLMKLAGFTSESSRIVPSREQQALIREQLNRVRLG